ncbi:hypothetical protein [Arcobacter vandammei]|nr:hypothetical protein [Arcobacter vandammei]
MLKILQIVLMIFIILSFNACFTSAHISSGGSVGMSVGGKVF